MDQLRIDCPSCGERISIKARKCRFCGFALQVDVVTTGFVSEKDKHNFIKHLLNMPKKYHSFTYSSLVKRLEKTPALLFDNLVYTDALDLLEELGQFGVELEIRFSQHPEVKRQFSATPGKPIAKVSEGYGAFATGLALGILACSTIFFGGLFFRFLEFSVQPINHLSASTNDPPLQADLENVHPGSHLSAEPERTTVYFIPTGSQKNLPPPTLIDKNEMKRRMCEDMDPKKTEQTPRVTSGQSDGTYIQMEDEATANILPQNSTTPIGAKIAEVSFADEPKFYTQKEIEQILDRLEKEYQRTNESLKDEIGTINRQIRFHQRNLKQQTETPKKLVYQGEIDSLKNKITKAIEVSLSNTINYHEENIALLRESEKKTEDRDLRQWIELKISSFTLQLNAAKKAFRSYK